MTEKYGRGNGWHYFHTTKTLEMNRLGWAGLIDRLVAWWTGEPQRKIQVQYTASVYGKGGDVKIDLWGMQIEEAPDGTTQLHGAPDGTMLKQEKSNEQPVQK